MCREVIKAPTDGQFDVQWADGKRIACSPDKLVKVPKVGTTFTRDGRKYQIAEYTTKGVSCKLLKPNAEVQDAPAPATPTKRLTRAAKRKVGEQQMSPGQTSKKKSNALEATRVSKQAKRLHDGHYRRRRK